MSTTNHGKSARTACDTAREHATNALDAVEAATVHVREGDLGSGPLRALAIARTKLEEANMWLDRVDDFDFHGECDGEVKP